MYTEEHITIDAAQLAYKYYQGTEQWLIVFHGFGQHSDYFHSLCTALQSSYSILSVDLFFHGNSSYSSSSDCAISIRELSEYIQTLLDKHYIDRFSILGFSIGGRFAVASASIYPKRIDQLILIAPDGIVINFWYRLATSTAIARALFKYVVLHPNLFLAVCKRLVSWNITDDRIVKFAASQMRSAEQRMQVYQSWVFFRSLKIKPSALVKLLRVYPIRFKLIFGSRDRIVKEQRFRSLIQQTHPDIFHVEASHSKIHTMLAQDKVIGFIVK